MEQPGTADMAARRPEIVARAVNRTLDATVRVDLSPAGRVFTAHALAPVSAAIAEFAGTEVAGWWFTRDALDLDGLPADAAWGIAADVVRIVMDRRYVEPDTKTGPGTSPGPVIGLARTG